MKKSPTNVTELDKVMAWIEQKRNENWDLRIEFRATRSLETLVNIQDNSDKICMASKWLANERVIELIKNQN